MTIIKKTLKVAVIMGSQSDYPVMKDCEIILKQLGVKHDVLIDSVVSFGGLAVGM